MQVQPGQPSNQERRHEINQGHCRRRYYGSAGRLSDGTISAQDKYAVQVPNSHGSPSSGDTKAGRLSPSVLAHVFQTWASRFNTSASPNKQNSSAPGSELHSVTAKNEMRSTGRSAYVEASENTSGIFELECVVNP